MKRIVYILLFVAAGWFQWPLFAEDKAGRTQANVPVEISFTAKRQYQDPFKEVRLDVLFTDPSGRVRRVPGFWAGGQTWKVRYASSLVGTHHWRSECSNGVDGGLHDRKGSVKIARYRGENPLFQHGPIRVATDKRHLEHSDGTPFFWLGDTWWMGLCQRLHWPEEFRQLAKDRKEKGVNVIQLVAGLYPDMHPFDARGANEAGFPWETNYARIRPEYFDLADQRLRYLVDEGFTPCIVGAWGYFIPWMGVEKAKEHWRYLVARYGSWPVVWCIAGEANLPWYLVKGFPYHDTKQVHDWTEVIRYVRATDPFGRLITIHPTGLGNLNARGVVEDVSLLDFDMLQTPHGQREAVGPTVKAMSNAFHSRPVMPVINGEAAYEMLMDKIPAEWPRAMFWLCMMNGAAGHTYGANGIWQCNRRDQPHGNSPHGANYGKISWDEAMNLPGSRQIGLGKKFLEDFPWHRCEPQPGTVSWADVKGTNQWGSWIWFPEGDPRRSAPAEARFFRRIFEVPKGTKVQRAHLSIAVDDRFTAWLNGKKIGAGANFSSPGKFDVTGSVVSGKNVLSVKAENLPAPFELNPAGLIATLEVEFVDGAKLSIASDASWRTSKTEKDKWQDADLDDSDWPEAVVTAPYGESPWGTFQQEDGLFVPFSMGVSDQLRIIYSPAPRAILVKGLRRESSYRLTHFDPVTGKRSEATQIRTTTDGEWRGSPPVGAQDWALALELGHK